MVAKWYPAAMDKRRNQPQDSVQPKEQRKNLLQTKDWQQKQNL